LIALFERAVGIYALFININAYNQPGVEVGKKAAASIIQHQVKILDLLANQREPLTSAEIAKDIDAE